MNAKTVTATRKDVKKNEHIVFAKQTIKIGMIKIRVVDCRTGYPIKGEPVKRVKINKRVISFKNNSIKQIPDKHITEHNAKIAFKAFGYSDGSIKEACKGFLTAGGLTPTEAQLDDTKLRGGLCEKIILHYNNLRQTTDEGIIKIPLFIEKELQAKVTIEVEFEDFPVICEEIRDDDRSDPLSIKPEREFGTDFSIEWKGGQNLGNNKMGWKAIKYKPRKKYYLFGPVVKKVDKEGEFRVFEVLTINGSKDVKESADLAKLKDDFWIHYDEEDKKSPHYEFMAMRWCQITWDDIEDPEYTDKDTGPVFNMKSYVQNKRFRNLHTHLVTRYTGGVIPYGCKGYGKAEGDLVEHKKWRGGGHPGYDLHASVGAPLFAFHGGQLKNFSDGEMGPNSIKLIPWNTNWLRLEYGHLSGRNRSVENKYVIAGTVVGYAGRTGNLRSYYPGHVHLNCGIDKKGYESIRIKEMVRSKGLDSINRLYLPDNDYPLLFPCATQVTNAVENPAGCIFCKDKFATNCWAAIELTCPYMKYYPANTMLRIQAQLRHLHFKNLNKYNDVVKQSGNVFVPSSLKRKKAIYAFKKTDPQLSKKLSNPNAYNEADSKITIEFLKKLEAAAPVRKPKL